MKQRMFVWLVFISIFCLKIDVYSQSAESDSILSGMDFAEIDETIKDLYPESKMDFGETVKSIISGDLEISADLVNQLVSDQIGYAFRVNRKTLGQMLILVILATLFVNFSQMFRNKQIGDIGFYVVYMLMITLAVKSFGIAISWTEDGIEQLVTFMKALCPVYFLAVTIAKGSVSSVAFYNIALLLIFLIELLILKILIPVIQVYVIVRFLDCLSEEEYLSKFSELMEVAIDRSLKVLLGLVIGLNGIQGLIAPAIDSVKRSAVTKGAEAIPGVGDALGGMAEVVLGTAVLVKNGIGAAGAIICIVICIVPLIQLGTLTILYKLLAAFVQPLSNKRMIQCISNMGEGCRLLCKLVFAVVVLFLLTIAIVAVTTGKT